MKLKKILTRAAIMAVFSAMLITGVVLADDITNDIDLTRETNWENITITMGDTETVGFSIIATSYGSPVCDVNALNPATVTLSVPSGVTINKPPVLTFEDCGVPQYINFSSVTPGQYDITVASVTGGVEDTDWYLDTARFNLTVNAPDITPPVITPVITGTLGSNNWNTTNTYVAWSISDPESAWSIDSGCVSTSITTETPLPGQTVSCTASSAGGASTRDVTIKVDKTAPTSAILTPDPLLPDGLNDWYKSNVVLTTTCDGELISLPLTKTSNQTQSLDTKGKTFTGRCTNNAGLYKTTNSVTIKRDATQPTIVWNTSIDEGETIYTDKLPSTPTCTASDPVSGPKSCTITGYSTAPGMHVMTATAIDNAGNVKIETRMYTVSGLTIKGFYSPFDMTKVPNYIKRGTNLDINWEVFRGTTEIKDKSIIKSLTMSQIKCPWKDSKFFENPQLISYTSIPLSSIVRDDNRGKFVTTYKLPYTTGTCFILKMTTTTNEFIQVGIKTKL